MKNLFIMALFLMSFTLMTACSGGGGGSAATDTGSAPQTTQGQFVDGPVQGLTYSTATQSGTTGADGSFSYIAGETVTFKIGDMTLGSAIGAATITPVDLVANGTTSDTAVVNMCRLLLSLDSDTDADRITIPDQVLTNAGSTEARIYINQLDFANAATFTSVAANLLSALTSGVSDYASTPALVDAATAQQHLENSLGSGSGGGGGGNGGTSPIHPPASFTAHVHSALTGGTVQDYNQAATYTYNANGQMVQFSVEDGIDDNGIALAKMTQTYTYNDKGQLAAKAQVNDWNNDGSSVTVRQTTYAYNDKGQRVSSSFSVGNDNSGTLVHSSDGTYTYNASGQLLSIAEYPVGSDIQSFSRTYTYNGKGQVATECWNWSDSSMGIIKNTYTYNYDANGQLLSYANRNEDNGTITGTGSGTYTYSANGQLLSLSTSNTNSDNSNMSFTYSYTINNGVDYSHLIAPAGPGHHELDVLDFRGW